MIHKALLAAVLLAAGYYDTAAGWDTVTIHVTNKLSTRRILILHCKSDDDDLGGSAIGAGANITLVFGQNVFGGTLFWCSAAYQDKRLSFKAYEQNDHNTFVKVFDVSDDGVGGIDVYSGNLLHISRWRIISHLNF
ncbi:unnamed protein product [Linum tenue]|uniref:S-protein homolog n=1 Tax=Linum tenue TaxID=586396 RepID=A0AAV0IDX0_9ROSI|nr:unnamed protein product [Linum tenue]